MGGAEDEQTPETFFDGHPEGLALFRAVRRAVEALGEAGVRVTKSQIAFRRRKAFAFVWRPGQYVNNDVPAVLSIALPRRISSDRIKSVAHPTATVWMHHIELSDPSQVDDEISTWLAEAYENAV